tara:strand:+ start:487 stop:678 length:192 start_codon:yes stop_codon:yes gene_type:complete
MKKYTLTIIYNEKDSEIESLTEKTLEDNDPLTINASPYVMEAFAQANLIGTLAEFNGEYVGEA